jgi:hypothetical protein
MSPTGDRTPALRIAHHGFYRIPYPSGHTFILVTGVLRIALIDGAGAPMVETPETMTALDPRAVISVEGQVVYDPRTRAPLPLPPQFVDWLRAHPEWPRVGLDEAIT